MARDAAPIMADWMARIEAMLEAADSLEAFREMLLAAQDELPEAALGELIGTGLAAAEAAGRFDIESADG
jgi:hypothetical protein